MTGRHIAIRARNLNWIIGQSRETFVLEVCQGVALATRSLATHRVNYIWWSRWIYFYCRHTFVGRRQLCSVDLHWGKYLKIHFWKYLIKMGHFQIKLQSVRASRKLKKMHGLHFSQPTSQAAQIGRAHFINPLFREAHTNASTTRTRVCSSTVQ